MSAVEEIDGECCGEDATAGALPAARRRGPYASTMQGMGGLALFVFVVGLSGKTLWEGSFDVLDEHMTEVFEQRVAENGPSIMGIGLGRWEILSMPILATDPQFSCLRRKVPKHKTNNCVGWTVWRLFEMAVSADDMPRMPANGFLPYSFLSKLDMMQHDGVDFATTVEMDTFANIFQQWSDKYPISTKIHTVSVSLNFAVHLFMQQWSVFGAVPIPSQGNLPLRHLFPGDEPSTRLLKHFQRTHEVEPDEDTITHQGRQVMSAERTMDWLRSRADLKQLKK
jgi:hypothetical protein